MSGGLSSSKKAVRLTLAGLLLEQMLLRRLSIKNVLKSIYANLAWMNDRFLSCLRKIRELIRIGLFLPHKSDSTFFFSLVPF